MTTGGPATPLVVVGPAPRRPLGHVGDVVLVVCHPDGAPATRADPVVWGPPGVAPGPLTHVDPGALWLASTSRPTTALERAWPGLGEPRTTEGAWSPVGRVFGQVRQRRGPGRIELHLAVNDLTTDLLEAVLAELGDDLDRLVVDAWDPPLYEGAATVDELASTLLRNHHAARAADVVAEPRAHPWLRRLCTSRSEGLASQRRELSDWRARRRVRAGVPLPPVSERGRLLLEALGGPDVDVHDVVDAGLSQMGDGEAQRTALALYDHFVDRDGTTALDFLGRATGVDPGVPGATRALVLRYLRSRREHLAIDLLLAEAVRDLGLDAKQAARLAGTVEEGLASSRAMPHGQVLVLDELLHTDRDWNGRDVVEIGSTREDVEGQGSTRQIADACVEVGARFTTVDMDPHNTRRAATTLADAQAEGEAINAKGEDWLQAREDPIAVLFLDAYDIEHGRHSELRRARYERHLGSSITPDGAQQMHLACAVEAVRLVEPGGVVVLDDTWVDDGHWVGKGSTAVPHLLSNGFEVEVADQRAVLLRRTTSAAT